MNPLERTILRQLFGNTEFAARVVPYLQDRYFETTETSTICKLFTAFFQKFQVPPAFSAARIGIAKAPLSESVARSTHDILAAIESEPLLSESQGPWILEQTELFVQDRAMYCALQDAVKIMDNPKKSPQEIPALMKAALSISFDQHIGHDYFKDADARYDFYHQPQTRIPFDLTVLNKLTRNGVPKKTLNVILAGTNVGKSLALCHLAAAYLRSSKNVLYITCEMAEEWISQRVDANMFDIPIEDVEAMPKVEYLRKINFLRATSTGQLKVKEYPTATASVQNFTSLLLDLKLKQDFVPDVIMVDYLTICASTRVKLNQSSVNSYSYGKFIAEELRGFAAEQDVPVWTAGQFNREGFSSTDPGLEHVGESFGIPQTADFCVALVSTDELEKLGQYALIELKNRYNQRRSYQQHLLGVDKPRMKLYDLSAQQLANAITLPSAPAPVVNPSQKAFSGVSGRRKPAVLGSLRSETSNAGKVSSASGLTP